MSFIQATLDRERKRRTQLKGPRIQPAPAIIKDIEPPTFTLSQETLDIIAELPKSVILPLTSACLFWNGRSIYGNGGYSEAVAKYIAAMPWWDGRAYRSPFSRPFEPEEWAFKLYANERTNEIRVCRSEFFRALEARLKE